VATLAVAEQQSDILGSLRALDGRATVGDVVAQSGLPADDVRTGLKSLLETHEGHLAVSDSGELIYEFDPGLIERGSEPFLARAKRTVTDLASKAFKAWIVIMLVVYFVVFVVLVLLALFANQRGNDSGGGWGGSRGRSRGGFHFDPLIWYWIWGPRWRIGRPYYGHRWERTLDKSDRVPFYKKVFAFVFGPDRPKPTQQQLDRSKLRLIRARSGVLTTAELMEHTGTGVREAESEMGRLLGAYDGEAAAGPEGELVYAFPGLMATVDERRRVREPSPAWLRLERPLELTGNTPGANAAVAGMNAFTLVASATAPWFIFPRLGIGGTAAFVALVLVPVVFSVVFFAGPLVRMAGVRMENRRRRSRNIRRVLLGLVYRRSLEGGPPIGVEEARSFVASQLEGEAISEKDVTAVLEELAADLDAEVSVADDGVVRYAFPAIRAQYEASEKVRAVLRLEDRTLGEIVFDTGDTTREESDRAGAAFERALADGTDHRLDRYLPAVDHVSYQDDFELVAFDEELARATGGPTP
jgi:hypothetical protein